MLDNQILADESQDSLARCRYVLLVVFLRRWIYGLKDWGIRGAKGGDGVLRLLACLGIGMM